MSDKEKELNEETTETENEAEEVKEESVEEETTAEDKEETTEVEETKEEVVEEETTAEDKEETAEVEEEFDEEVVETKEKNNKKQSKKSEVEKKIQKKIQDKEEKEYKVGFYRIAEYIKTEHKWENFLFLALSAIVMVLGGLILNGALVVRENMPLIGEHPDIFGWILLGMGFLFLLYSLYPFFKPAFPELKKITWLTGKKFLADLLRVFLFIIILVSLFILYDALITGVLRLIF